MMWIFVMFRYNARYIKLQSCNLCDKRGTMLAISNYKAATSVINEAQCSLYQTTKMQPL